MSPHGPSSPYFSSSSNDSMSRYASAQNLQELDLEGGDGNNNDCDYGANEMIDAKAEASTLGFDQSLQPNDERDSYDFIIEETSFHSLG